MNKKRKRERKEERKKERKKGRQMLFKLMKGKVLFLSTGAEL